MPTLVFIVGAFVAKFGMEDSFAHVPVSDCLATVGVTVGICGPVDGIDVENYDAMMV